MKTKIVAVWRKIDASPLWVPVVIIAIVIWALTHGAGCGGRVEEATTCVARDEARSCASGDVLVYSETTDDAGARVGTMTTCRSTCVVGSSCVFPGASGFVDGICE